MSAWRPTLCHFVTKPKQTDRQAGTRHARIPHAAAEATHHNQINPDKFCELNKKWTRKQQDINRFISHAAGSAQKYQPEIVLLLSSSIFRSAYVYMPFTDISGAGWWYVYLDLSLWITYFTAHYAMREARTLTRWLQWMKTRFDRTQHLIHYSTLY